jgi:hypothetical protein
LCTECLVAKLIEIADEAVFNSEMLLLVTKALLDRQPDDKIETVVKDVVPELARLRADLEEMRMFVPGLPDEETR